MGLKRTYSRKAFSPVLSALILSAVVIAVGGAIWAFSQGAMTITAEDYVESVINMTDTISERFIIEHVGYVSGELTVWVFNYGDVDIEFKVEIGDNTWPEDWMGLASKDIDSVPLTGFPPSSGELNIRVYSRRGNDAYYRLIVPS
ncbi:MAG: hypothetical protein NWE89_06155 [Candidatus Bathyarchaeota archaeon]|nr:hypothetical protein [Candidatus Bathyarchaeota archaeon]